jgi:hypothetical protein
LCHKNGLIVRTGDSKSDAAPGRNRRGWHELANCLEDGMQLRIVSFELALDLIEPAREIAMSG